MAGFDGGTSQKRSLFSRARPTARVEGGCRGSGHFVEARVGAKRGRSIRENPPYGGSGASGARDDALDDRLDLVAVHLGGEGVFDAIDGAPDFAFVAANLADVAPILKGGALERREARVVLVEAVVDLVEAACRLLAGALEGVAEDGEL